MAGILGGATGVHRHHDRTVRDMVGGFKPATTDAERLQPPVLDSRDGRLRVELTALTVISADFHAATSALG